MYDLQLRGAGDILGAQQSGFVVKVGYELFLKMISEAVADLQASTDKAEQTEIITQYPYYISADYIEDPRIRLDYYKLLSGATDRVAVQSLLDELVSQYGELKLETTNLASIMLIKNLAGAQHIVKAGVYPKMVKLTFSPKAAVNPAMLGAAAAKLRLKYRFAGEFDFVLAFETEEETLEKCIRFLELCAIKEGAKEGTVA
jgi:transcription-repair coupling factor (superfamily II helicase)